jgi:hypothetical protein
MDLVSEPQTFLDLISQPWHWTVGGVGFGLLVLLLTWMGRSFGISTSLRDWCTIAGAGKKYEFFNVNLKDETWRIALVLGLMAGAFLAHQFLRSPEPVAISQSTIDYLGSKGISYPESDALGLGFVPTSLFNFGNLKGLIMAILGGFLVGFGARYAGGCTSGHAITGLSHLQLPSLITVIGFFIGGLIMTHLILPWLL